LNDCRRFGKVLDRFLSQVGGQLEDCSRPAHGLLNVRMQLLKLRRQNLIPNCEADDLAVSAENSVVFRIGLVNHQRSGANLYPVLQRSARAPQ
jgi:hypothetical protein